MTLLVMLFVVSTYVVVPWWAWALGWLKVSCYVVFIGQQVVEKFKQQKIMKENERIMADLANRYTDAARAHMQGHQGQVPNSMN